MIKYGLRRKAFGSILCCVASDGARSHELRDLGMGADAMWLTSEHDAEAVRKGDCPWADGTYYNPKNNYKTDELEVVKITITVGE